MNKKNILIISPEPWGTNWLSKHHYAQALKNYGHNVYFLNPPENTLKITDHKGVKIIDYKSSLRGKRFFPWIRKHYEQIEIKRINSLANVNSWDLVWTFDPFRFQNLNLFKTNKSIFFASDIHFTKLDLFLAKNVDLVVAPSEAILDKYRDISKTTLFVNHGLAEHFVSEVFAKWQKSEPIKAVYIGNLHGKYIDKETLKVIIENNNNVSFTFVGPFDSSNLSKSTANRDLVSFLESRNNVKLTGSKTTEELIPYLNKADLFLVCYDSDRYPNEVSNSHKILEYLSTGKVTVANYTSSYKDKPQLLQMSKTQKELPDLFNRVVLNLEYFNSMELQALRRKFALENSYQRHTRTILQLVEV